MNSRNEITKFYNNWLFLIFCIFVPSKNRPHLLANSSLITNALKTKKADSKSLLFCFFRVGGGARTHDLQIHNLAL